MVGRGKKKTIKKKNKEKGKGGSKDSVPLYVIKSTGVTTTEWLHLREGGGGGGGGGYW